MDITPNKEPVLATGTAGGVDNDTVLLLSNLGYEVATAASRKTTHQYLKKLRAAQILAIEEACAQYCPL